MKPPISPISVAHLVDRQQWERLWEEVDTIVSGNPHLESTHMLVWSGVQFPSIWIRDQILLFIVRSQSSNPSDADLDHWLTLGEHL